MDRDTLEMLSIVRTLPNAPDVIAFSSADGGIRGYRTCRHGRVRASSEENLNLFAPRAPHIARRRKAHVHAKPTAHDAPHVPA